VKSDIDLKRIQRNVYLSFFQDGLWDILLGLFLLGWGITKLTDADFLPGAVFISGYLAVWGIKKYITYPRIGYAKLSATSRRRITTRFLVLLSVTALLGLLVSVLFGIGTVPQWLTDYFPLLFNGMLAGIVCFASYWARVNRFYLYAALIFLAGILRQWFGIGWEYGFIGSGSLIVFVGLVYLISFLRKYPKTLEEVDVNVN